MSRPSEGSRNDMKIDKPRIRNYLEAVSGYVETIIKSGEAGVISESLSNKLKPFFDFRNSLVPRYWII
jgi:uncharacterized protein YutE (UPF0331/DUF86 family)